MSLTRLNMARFLLLTFLSSVSFGGVAQGLDCGDIFRCTMDTRWPVDLTLNPHDQYTRLIVVRKQPGQSVDPEAYLIIRIGAHGSVTADYSMPEGESLFNQIRDRAATLKSPQEINAVLKVRTVHLTNTSALRELVREYQRLRMSPATPEALYLDAPRYEIADVTVMNRLVLRISDSSVLPRNALLLWAKKALAVCGRAALTASPNTRH